MASAGRRARIEVGRRVLSARGRSCRAASKPHRWEGQLLPRDTPSNSEFGDARSGRAVDPGGGEGRAAELTGAEVLLTELTVPLLDGAVGEQGVRPEAGEVTDLLEVEVDLEAVGGAARGAGQRAIRVVLVAGDRQAVVCPGQLEPLEHQDAPAHALVAGVGSVRPGSSDHEGERQHGRFQHDAPRSPACDMSWTIFESLKSIGVFPFPFSTPRAGRAPEVLLSG